jgi:hypothetical protein
MYTIHKRGKKDIFGKLILILSDVRGVSSRDVLGLWEDDRDRQTLAKLSVITGDKHRKEE